jgi:phosphatidylserine/phosphatidylglycerophosphate/cardiolipin synthase-like enzyme
MTNLSLGALARTVQQGGAHLRFAAGQPKPDADGLQWFYTRPQAKDTITHSQGFQTKVTSLIGGGQIFNNIDYVLRNAKKSVLVDMYEIQNSKVNPERTAPANTPGANYQEKIVDHLIQLSKQGVKVKVILDNSFDRDKQKYHNQAMIDHLKANGVETLAYPQNGAKISHVKLLIVDDKYAVIGGMNWGNHSAANQDACVMLEGDDVANLANDIFKVDYQFSGGDVNTLPQFKSFPQEKIKVLTTTPCGSPDGGKTEILEAIVDRIDNAQKSIICELFTLTDRIVAEKLITAHKRLSAAGQPGVRILVDPGLYLKFKNCRPVIDYLKNSGVPIKFYKVDWGKEEKLHAKWGVFDGEDVIVGSANWSKVGLESNCSTDPGFSHQLQFAKGNHEAALSIKSPQICKAFTKQFEFDWNKKSMPARGPGAIYNSIPEGIRNTLYTDIKAEDVFGPRNVFRTNNPPVQGSDNDTIDGKDKRNIP